MSITIVSALPTPTQATATDGTASDVTDGGVAAAGRDFAALLLGQLTITLPEATVQTDKPEADTTPIDAASLLAALGLAQPEQKHDTDTPPASDASAAQSIVALGFVPLEASRNADTIKTTDTSLAGIGKVEKSTSNPLTALQTSTDGQEPKAETTKTESGLTGTTLAADVKPAIIAVATASTPKTENEIAKSISADATSNNLSALTSNVSGHSNSLAVNRDASVSVSTPVRDQNWAGDFGQKIVWLATHDKQSAQLTLNPPQMGPIEVSLNVEKGNATASFVSANADVREAIETALPRLREMFASAGIELGQTNVSAESFRQQAGNGNGGNQGASLRASDNAILIPDSASSSASRAFATQQGQGLVDLFA